MDETIWISPRAVAFVEVCRECEERHPELAGTPGVTLSGALALDATRGWATCARGHTVRVLRMGTGMPAGALR